MYASDTAHPGKSGCEDDQRRPVHGHGPLGILAAGLRATSIPEHLPVVAVESSATGMYNNVCD